MSKKFTGFFQWYYSLWETDDLAQETHYVFSRDIVLTHVSRVSKEATAYFAIALASTRQIVAHATVPPGDVQTPLTVVGGGKLVLRANERYVFSRWHASSGDMGWGVSPGTEPYSLGNGMTVTAYQADGYRGTKLNAPGAFLYTQNLSLQTFGTQGTLPYFWWEENVTVPPPPTTVTAPSRGVVLRNVNVSWSAVPLPTQPNGTVLADPTVYYEVSFMYAGNLVTVTSKTVATSVSYTIPSIGDFTSVESMFAIRAFIELHGSRYYGEYKNSNLMNITNNAIPTIPGTFASPTSNSAFTIGRSYSISWGGSTDADGDTVVYDLEYFNGQAWSTIVRNSLLTTRTFHVPSGPNTLRAQFRVRATDGIAYSDYRYSSEFKVEANTAPNIPQPFTHPTPDEFRYVGMPYRVEWGGVTRRPDQDPIRYEVQSRARQTDNWTTIRGINDAQATTTFLTHTIPNVQDSANAQYRVRAYDGLDYGDWQESSFFKIASNRVTNTSGFNEELRSRYAVGQEIHLSWSAGTTLHQAAIFYDFEVFDGFRWTEIMQNITSTNIIFRIPEMNDTSNAKFRIRAKTPYTFGGYIYSDWLETRTFSIFGFFKYSNIVIPYPKDIQKKENVDYLRSLVNEMRSANSLPLMNYTDAIIQRYSTPIKDIHFDEIEQGILECYRAHPSGHFNNSKTETELSRDKTYASQQELLMDLPERLSYILRALTNS